jgi:hypothetical protein
MGDQMGEMRRALPRLAAPFPHSPQISSLLESRPSTPNPEFLFCTLHRVEFHACSRPSTPNPEFLFRTLHRIEIPHPAFVSPLAALSQHNCATIDQSPQARNSIARSSIIRCKRSGL